MNWFHCNWMRKQKMRTQIIILNLFLLFVTLILIEITFYMDVLIINKISSDTVKILSYQDANSIIKGAVFLSTHVQSRQKQIIRQIQSVKQFFDFYQLNDFQITNLYDLEPCLQQYEVKSIPFFLQIPRFCYQANGVEDSVTIPKEEITVHHIAKVISLLNPFSLMQDSMAKYVLQIATLSKTQFFAQFPFCTIYKNYDIRQRAWYQYHLDQSLLFPNQSLFISSLYQYFNTSQLEIAATQSVFQNGNLIAIVKQSMKVQANLIPKVPYNILLVDQNANVVYQNNQSLINQSKYYVYDENETGLNKTDWEIIESFSLSHDNNNRHNDHVQLIDKRFDTVINAHSEKFYPENFTFIVTSNVTNTIELQKQFKQMDSEMMYQFLKIILLQVSVFMFIILVEILIITKIFKPMAQIQSLIKNHVNSVGNNVDINMYKIAFSKQHFHCETNLSNQFFHLQDIFNKSQHSKSEVCKQQESIKLNKKERNLNTQFIRKGLKYVKNQRNNITKNCLGFIHEYYQSLTRSKSF